MKFKYREILTALIIVLQSFNIELVFYNYKMKQMNDSFFLIMKIKGFFWGWSSK